MHNGVYSENDGKNNDDNDDEDDDGDNDVQIVHKYSNNSSSCSQYATAVI